MLTRPEVECLAELDADELDVVLDALTTGGVLHSGPAYRAGSRSAPTAVGVRPAPEAAGHALAADVPRG